MNFCPNCATSVELNQTYCRECNFDLSKVKEMDSQEITNIENQSSYQAIQPTPNEDSGESSAVAGLIIGIIGWLLPIPFIDLILCFLGIGLSWQGINSSKSGIAGLGVVVGIFGAIASIVFWF
jgi:hypothetical protein